MPDIRYDRLMEALSRLRLPGIVITDMKNIRYFSGFTGSDGVLVVGENGGIFLTDGRYTTQASSEVNAFTVTEYRNKIQGIVDAVGALKLKKIGVESHALSLFFYNALTSRFSGRRIVPIDEDLALLRMVKDQGEIAVIRESIRISEESFREATRLMRPGTREDEIATELEYGMKKRGSGMLPFPIIVASGTNGALPHAHAGERKLEAGDLVTVDFGAQYRGYHCDQTVTVMIGRDGPKEREVHGVVLEAQQRAIAAIKPGVPTKDVDALARGYIKEHGYGDYFTHGTGHGVGLDVHEPPTVSPMGKEILQEGMIITVEPGIYIPGWGGVRIEDMVLVEKAGPSILTTIPKSFRVVS